MPFNMQTNIPTDAVSQGLSAARRAREIGLDQQNVADALGINQSQVSRIFSGKIRRNTDTLMRVCKFVASQSLAVHPDEVRRNDVLVCALADVWDGTEKDACVLAGVIRSLGALRKSDKR